MSSECRQHGLGRPCQGVRVSSALCLRVALVGVLLSLILFAHILRGGGSGGGGGGGVTMQVVGDGHHMQGFDTQPVYFWKHKKTGSSTMAMLLAVHAARSGARIAPCRAVAQACGTPVVPLLKGLLPTASGRGALRHDVVLNHCHCSAAGAGPWARSVVLDTALFGGRTPVEIMTIREPLSRLVSMYHWFGSSADYWSCVPGVSSRLTSHTAPPSEADAIAFATAPQLSRGGLQCGGSSSSNSSNSSNAKEIRPFILAEKQDPVNSWRPVYQWARFARDAASGQRHLERRILPIIMEHYDESLVLLRSRLQWPMHSILSTPTRRPSPNSLPSEHATAQGERPSVDAWPVDALRHMNRTLQEHGEWALYAAALGKVDRMAQAYRPPDPTPLPPTGVAGVGASSPPPPPPLQQRGRAALATAVEAFQEARAVLSDQCQRNDTLLRDTVAAAEALAHISCTPPPPGTGILRTWCKYINGGEYGVDILAMCMQRLYATSNHPRRAAWVW